MALYPKSFIQRLRDEIPVSQIVGTRITLKKKGREFEACCPFHQEKSPSFFVNDQKGFYHCFGCSEHGDALKFLMEYDRLSYPQAIEALAREAGIPLPETTPEMQQQERKRTTLLDVVALANEWFRQQLTLAHGQEARDYLVHRGLSQQTIDHFGLGFAPDDKFALKHYLADEGVSEQQMVETGLMIQLDDASRTPYARFRGRVMFPITNFQGEPIAFGGRLLHKSDTMPKYLNSPETPLFHKGNVLYNWKNAKIAARDDVPFIVTEGYMDVIALHQHGFHTAVAPLGTALTEMHLKGLWRYQDNPILSFDGDAAGKRAMWRSAELALPMLQPGKTLRFLSLPAGQDPDDFLQANGAVALQKRIDDAIPLSQHIYQFISLKHGNQTPEARAAADNELHQLATKIQHEGVQHHFRQYFKEQRYQKPANNTYRKSAYYTPKQPELASAPPPPSLAKGLLRTKQQMLKLLILHPDLMHQAAIVNTLEMIDFKDAQLSAVQLCLLEREPHLNREALALQDDTSVTLPTQAMAENVQLVWQQLIDGLTLAQIESEISQLQREVTEESLKQLQALKAEKDAIMHRQFL